ncbi:MAG: radical SAM protein [Anaerolineae bacterium]|nr:radical SAM protein [Anaerolineae bacterium]
MTCVQLPTLGFDEFNASIRVNGIPVGGGMELTHRCNLNCIHCYCRKPAGDRDAQAAEMTLAEIDRIGEQLVEESCLYLFLTGGEPMLRPDFLDVYNCLRSKGLLLTLFTNGTLITAEIADHLAKKPPLVVHVSLYGARADTYEAITGVPGSYRSCRHGISLLLDRGIRVVLKTPVLTLNRDEVEDLQALADELGVRFLSDFGLHPRLEGMEDPSGPYRYMLSLEERMELERSRPGRLDAWRAYVERLKGLPRQNTMYQCGAGLRGFFIDVHGALVMCVEARSPAYDLRAGNFREGWAFLCQLRALPMRSDMPCRSCEIYMLCRQCPGRSQLEYGQDTPDRRVELLCREAQERARIFRNLGLI